MNMYITDKDGKQHWRVTVSADFASGERNNMKRRLAACQAGHYAWVDAASARLIEVYEEGEMSPDDILNELLGN